MKILVIGSGGREHTLIWALQRNAARQLELFCAPGNAGIADEFERQGLRIVGPGRAAARLEASKAFAKDFMRRHEIPTARYRIASSADEAIAILQSGEFGEEAASVVVKADG